MKQKILGALGLAGALAVLYVFAMPSYRQGEPSVAGRRAPDFTVEADGRQFHLSDLRGKVVVLDFWASWCPPCVEEAPSLNALQQRIAEPRRNGRGHQPGRRSLRISEIPDRTSRQFPHLSRYNRATNRQDPELRHRHAPRSLPDQPRWPHRPQNRRPAGLDQPRTERGHRHPASLKL